MIWINGLVQNSKVIVYNGTTKECQCVQQQKHCDYNKQDDDTCLKVRMYINHLKK